jgi:hypothetical protein
MTMIKTMLASGAFSNAGPDRPRLPEPAGPPEPAADHPHAGFYRRPPRTSAQPADQPADLPHVPSGSGYAM